MPTLDPTHPAPRPLPSHQYRKIGHFTIENLNEAPDLHKLLRLNFQSLIFRLQSMWGVWHKILNWIIIYTTQIPGDFNQEFQEESYSRIVMENVRDHLEE